MKSMIMTLFTRTPLHVGAGSSVGAIDMPVQRERHTRIPIIPATSIKGVLADLWPVTWVEDANKEKLKAIRERDARWLFGAEEAKQAAAGALIIGEARVLAFPVRSAKNGFAWVTCPLALRRFARDTNEALTVQMPESEMDCFAPADLIVDKGRLVLEEFVFEVKGAASVLEPFRGATSDKTWEGFENRLVILSDTMFCHFVEHACEVVTRIKIDDMTGTVAGTALFNQEQVPAETLFYCVIHAVQERCRRESLDQPLQQPETALAALTTRLQEEDFLLQVGGHETVGLGLCTITLKELA